MAQLWIREYDAKKMFAAMTGTSYQGYSITVDTDMNAILPHDPQARRVVKPDQLFGKRG